MKSRFKVAFAALALATATAAQAKPYTLMIYESAQQLALRTDPGPKGQAYWAAFAAIGQDVAKAGVLKGGAPLDLPGTVKRVTVRDGQRELVTSDAAFTLTLSGYLVIDVADETAALEWAAKVPAATTGLIEVRPHAPSMTGM